MDNWQLLNEITRVSSRWVTLVAEHWLDDKKQTLEYWRVEKTDSVIVLPIHRGHLLTVSPTFRPGVHRHTFDFPGGRLPGDKDRVEVAQSILERELGVPKIGLSCLQALNKTKWDINSSFSNQGLWGFVAEIDATFSVSEQFVGHRVRADINGVVLLCRELECLQCRAVLLEWWFRQQIPHEDFLC